MLVSPDRLLLLPGSLEATSPAGRSMATTFFADHRHPLGSDWLTGVPVCVSTPVHALVSVEVSHEVAFICLRSNDASLRCKLASPVDQLVVA